MELPCHGRDWVVLRKGRRDNNKMVVQVNGRVHNRTSVYRIA